MNYYNDHEPFAAQWLKNLVAAGLLPPGEVDSRDIQEVAADELREFTQCHFFAGIGGWPLALQLAGWPTTRPVWTGSCPCQPFSVAGKGKGVDDDRHIWPEFRRLITDGKPPAVFGEQVASADGRKWLSGVRADLENLGYGVGAADLCAAGVSAPHIRQRLYWVADSDDHEPQKTGSIGKRKFRFLAEGGRNHGDARLSERTAIDGLADAPDGDGGGAESAERKQELGRTKSGGGDLQAVALIAGWVTPSSRDYKDTPGMSLTGTNPDGTTRMRIDQLPRQAAIAGQTTLSSHAETGKRGVLNPELPRWLMGYPEGWGSYADTVTRFAWK